MAYIETIAQSLNLIPRGVEAVIELSGEGNTVPFIARYRKEATGNLDEEQIREILALHEKLTVLDHRRTFILESVESQGKLTDELKEKILTAQSLNELEDLYAPYKQKRKTRASVARENGLQPIADLILSQDANQTDRNKIGQQYISEKIQTVEEAFAGAHDIVAETIAENALIRGLVREKTLRIGTVTAEKIAAAADEKKTYELYYQFSSRIDRLKPHQVLAMNRGEAEGILKIKIIISEQDWRSIVNGVYPENPRSIFCEDLNISIRDSAERLLLPAIERDVRRSLKENAEKHAIAVFADNLRALLGQPPLKGHTVLGIDPGFRTGCKLAIVDPTGKLVTTGTIYPHEPQSRWADAINEIRRLIRDYKVTLISIGNGTASRETEKLAAEVIKSRDADIQKVRYVIVNEAGASVYSASPLARAEFPQLDVSLRGAVSIARRIQDPLAELVKIDPKSIGVGLYQHDVDQSQLSLALQHVVEGVVNWVGVDLNTASPALLTYVSGIGPKLAEAIVLYRDTNGSFKNREELKKVPKLGAKAFEQSAGFLRLLSGTEPLDATAIHPESYSIARAIIRKAGIGEGASPEETRRLLALLRRQHSISELGEMLGIGSLTLTDILDQLARPGRDPRADAPLPILRSDVLKMEDLTQGMVLNGTVRNVVDFGAFIDIGVKQDGLIHRSQIPSTTHLKVGDIIQVEVIKLDMERGRIGLSIAR